GKVGGLGDVGVAVERPGAQATTRIGVNAGEFFATLFPGLVLFGLMFIGQVLALRLLRDRTRGLQRRLLTTPVSATAAILGSMLFLVTALVVMLGVLGLLATAVFRVHLRAPAALLAFGFGFAAFTAGMQLTVGALAASDRGARAISSGVIMLLSLLGGSFVPIE